MAGFSPIVDNVGVVGEPMVVGVVVVVVVELVPMIVVEVVDNHLMALVELVVVVGVQVGVDKFEQGFVGLALVELVVE